MIKNNPRKVKHQKYKEQWRRKQIEKDGGGGVRIFRNLDKEKKKDYSYDYCYWLQCMFNFAKRRPTSTLMAYDEETSLNHVRIFIIQGSAIWLIKAFKAVLMRFIIILMGRVDLSVYSVKSV